MQSRIARTAESLFVAKGFEETTVDEIAAAVGMSQRSFFRYFASKDEVVLDNLERLSESMAARLADRPLEEPDWDALRRAFDPAVERFADTVFRKHDAAIQRIIDRSPRLLAAYLCRLERMQRSLTEALLERAARRGGEPDRVVLRALVGGACSCLHAAAFHVDDPGCEADGGAAGHRPEDIADALDRSMAALRPAACG